GVRLGDEGVEGLGREGCTEVELEVLAGVEAGAEVAVEEVSGPGVPVVEEAHPPTVPVSATIRATTAPRLPTRTALARIDSAPIRRPPPGWQGSRSDLRPPG
ncbi:MAG: hypothetical protein L0I04_07760, partial [Acidipropionibacterium jensenii]